MTVSRPRHVDPNRRPSWLRPVIVWLATNPSANRLSRLIGWKVDPLLLRISRGRLATTVIIPTEVLETIGARTGRTRRNAVIYFHDGVDRIVIVASHAGAPHHPAWYHNLVANPEVVFAGVPMRATVIDDGPDLDRLWRLADQVFPAYAVYRDRAAQTGRSLPIVALTRAPPPETVEP